MRRMHGYQALSKRERDELLEKIEKEQEDGDEESTESRRHSYTWSANGSYSFMVMSYTIQKYLKAVSSDRREEKIRSGEFEYDYGRRSEVLTKGRIIFTLGDRIFVYSADDECGIISIYSDHGVNGLVEDIKKEIRLNNPLRNKHMEIVPTYRGTDFHCLLKKPPSIGFADIVLNEAVKEDIYDNTIFHIKNIEGNNGIILHGEPGTGKSLICQAVINAALEEGYSTCFATIGLNYAFFDEFLGRFLGRCVVIFEDIDAIGQDREYSRNENLSGFLQLISGLYEREEKVVFIATTNYIEHLDKAIVKRPVRFNRKFRIEIPGEAEMRRLVSLYFGDAPVDPALCNGKNFTGAHIKEVRRTAEMLSLKRGIPVADAYGEAVGLVEKNFTTKTSSPGF